jgi:hypothetical protein
VTRAQCVKTTSRAIAIAKELNPDECCGIVVMGSDRDMKTDRAICSNADSKDVGICNKCCVLNRKKKCEKCFRPLHIASEKCPAPCKCQQFITPKQFPKHKASDNVGENSAAKTKKPKFATPQAQRDQALKMLERLGEGDDGEYYCLLRMSPDKRGLLCPMLYSAMNMPYATELMTYNEHQRVRLDTPKLKKSSIPAAEKFRTLLRDSCVTIAAAYGEACKAHRSSSSK